MERNFRREIATTEADTSLSDGTWEFVQAILGKPVLGASKAESDAHAEREQLEWLADVSPRHERPLRGLQREAADTAVPREQPEWLDALAERVQSHLQEWQNGALRFFAAMSEASGMLSAEQMKRCYGGFYDRGANLHLDRGKVPERFWSLLSNAEFWGIADDLTREILVKDAPADVQRNLKAAVAAFDNAMDEWLAGPEADNTSFSDEYIAYSSLRMAADYI